MQSSDDQRRVNRNSWEQLWKDGVINAVLRAHVPRNTSFICLPKIQRALQRHIHSICSSQNEDALCALGSVGHDFTRCLDSGFLSFRENPDQLAKQKPKHGGLFSESSDWCPAQNRSKICGAIQSVSGSIFVWGRVRQRLVTCLPASSPELNPEPTTLKRGPLEICHRGLEAFS